MSSLALVLLAVRAFSAGSVGLTGTEAIATGVPAFKPPEARNAATTLAVMSVILGTLFVGITFLANGFGLIPNDEVTIIAQAAEAVFGEGSIGFFLFLTFTTLILMLAANTSFAAFPVLAAVLAGDRFFPRAFSFRGERLAYTLGIVVLGVVGLHPHRRLQRRHHRAHPASTRWPSSPTSPSASRAWSCTGCATRRRAGSCAWPSTPSARSSPASSWSR